jgi:molecular chaperone HtpG
VDSQDLSLNISREMLQKDNQLKLIHNALEKKIKNELHAMLANDREKYEAFWKNFGRQLKFGCYSDYGMHSDLLKDLLLFYSAKEKKMVTLAEYAEKMPPEQKCVYFAAGDAAERLAKLPAAELVLDKGYDVLLLTEDVDEFCLQIVRTCTAKDADGKDREVEFKNVNSGDLGLESDAEKKAAEEATAENKPLFDAMKAALGEKVKEIKVSTRLKDHPVCLSSAGPLSIEMEKVLSNQPGGEAVKSDRVLELNAAHPVFAALRAAQELGDTEKVRQYSEILYAQAELIEGLPVDDPVAYAQAVCSLMK